MKKVWHYSPSFLIPFGAGSLGLSRSVLTIEPQYIGEVSRVLAILGVPALVVGVSLMARARPQLDPKGHVGAACLALGLVGILLLAPAPTSANLQTLGTYSLASGVLILLGFRFGVW